MGRAIYVCVGNPAEDKAELLAEADAGKSTWWTICSAARPRDGVLFYFTSPDSSVCVRGTVLTKPEKDEDPHSGWEGKYFAEVGELEVFAYPVSRLRMLREYPAWPFWRWPQSAVRVPVAFERRVWSLFDEPVLSAMRVEAAGETLLRPVVMNYHTKRMREEALREIEPRRREVVLEVAASAGVSEACVVLSVHAAASGLGVVFDEALDGLEGMEAARRAARHFEEIGWLEPSRGPSPTRDARGGA